MLIRIQPEANEPIFEQIVHQFVLLIAAQTIDNGTVLPSIRELAKELLVNPNTVARAYQELERQGILVAHRGKGMDLADQAVKRCRELRGQRLKERLGVVLQEARSSGLELETVKQWVDEEWGRGAGRVRKESR